MFKFLKMASTVSLCGALMMTASSSEAALVNYNFNGIVDSGSLFESNYNYNGSFNYDNATLTNTGAESIDLSSLSFNFLSNTFNLASANSTSTADFLDGVFLGVSYSVNSFDPTFLLVSGSESTDTAYFSYSPASGEAGFGSLTYTTSVPVPAAVWLFGSALAGFGAINRRKRQITL